MSTIVEIPSELQPAIQAAIARGGYANEQELVNEILRAAVPALGEYQQLRRDIQSSLEDVAAGKIREADFESVREQLCNEFDEHGTPK